MIPVLSELLDGAELRRRGFTSAIALTYGVDLLWFEQHVGRQLRIAGVRRFAVLADAYALDETLARDGADIEGAGTWYSIIGIRGAGAFHPKAILLTGPTAARLYVGSGNLNPSGLGRNLELFERWDASISDGQVDRVFEDFRCYLDQVLLAQNTPMPHIDETLREAFSQPVLRQPRVDGASRLYGGHARAPSMLFDVVPPLATPATSLVMTAPFFDAEGQLAVELARRFKAESFELIVDVGMTNITQRARQAIEGAGGIIRAVNEDRAVHAKAVTATGDGWCLSMHGSANLSNAAWRGHNAELLVMHRDVANDRIAEALKQLTTRPMTDQDWQKLADAEPDDPTTSDASLIIDAATWVDHEHVELIISNDDFSRDLAATAISGARSLREPALAHAGRRRVRFAECRGNSLVVRLEHGGAFGPWLVVHDPSILRQHAAPRSPFDDAVDQLEGHRSGDSTQALLDLLSAIADERREANKVQSRPKAAAQHPDMQAEHWVWVTPDDFAQAGPEAVPVESTDQDDGRPDPSRLLRRLVLGDPVRTETVEIQDGTPDDPNDEPARRDEKKAPPDLGKAVERIQKAYLARLRQPVTASPARLLQELLVLVAAFQDAARQGSITDRQLANSLVALGDAVFAGAMPRSLKALDDGQRDDLWQRAPVLAASVLAIYNMCLVTTLLDGDAPPDSMFSDLRPILWLRDLVRHAPSSDPAWLLRHVEEHLVRIRRFSVLWIADRWPYFDQLLPFEEFVRDAVTACCLLERVDDSLRSLPPPSYSFDDDDRVVGLGRDQRLAVGFRESEEHQKLVKVLLFDGAFQKPGPQQASQAPEPKPYIGQTSRVRSFAQLRSDLGKAGWTATDIESAMLLLGQLVDS